MVTSCSAIQLNAVSLPSEFRYGKAPILIATDVASRGLDVEDVKFVINYDYPNSSEDYIHRIGRTARSQKTGTAYTFFTPNNMKQASDLISVLREANQAINPKLIQMAEDRGGRGRGGRGGYKDDRRDRYSGGGRSNNFGGSSYRDRDSDRGFGSGPKSAFGGNKAQNGGSYGGNGGNSSGSYGNNYSNSNGQGNFGAPANQHTVYYTSTCGLSKWCSRTYLADPLAHALPDRAAMSVDEYYISPGHTNMQLFQRGMSCSYGPLGTELRRNVLEQWWRSVSRSGAQVFGISSLSCSQDKAQYECGQLGITDSKNFKQTLDQKELSKEQLVQKVHMLLQRSPSVRTNLLQGALEQFVPSLELVNRKLPFGLAETGLCFQPSDGSGCLRSLHQTSAAVMSQRKNLSRQHLVVLRSSTTSRGGQRRWRRCGAEEMQSCYRHTKESVQNYKSADSFIQCLNVYFLSCRDGRKSVPHVVSVTGNVDRGLMAFLSNSLQQLKREDTKQKLQQRKVLKLHPVLTPVKVALDIGRGATMELRQVCEGLLQEFMEAKISAWPGYLETIPTSMEQLNAKYIWLIGDHSVCKGKETVVRSAIQLFFLGVPITHPTGSFLQIIKESQQQHGLRHGDYQRYRGYCSRRLRRLRKTLSFKMGNRHKFIGKKITVEILSDSRYLLLVLMEAERAWSYAMQLKQEANTEPRKRFHLLSRLRKAAKHSEKLEKLCESPRVDAKTKLEAQAYTAYLTGMVEFELQEWKLAMEAFNKCKTIYEKLASAFTEEMAVLYRQRVDEISPNIRYCAYNIGDQNAINDLMQMRLTGGGGGMMAEKLESLITQARTKQAATMSEVEWRGRSVPVKIDKARVFLLGLADNEAAIAQFLKSGLGGSLLFSLTWPFTATTSDSSSFLVPKGFDTPQTH
ncbi:hypothetical protein PAMA_016201 [Pampus argenteus]